MAKQLRAYQLEAVERAVQANTYVAYDCGIGKTIIAIESVRRLCALSIETVNKYRIGLPWALIVVSPKASLPQWRDAILDQHESAQVILGTNLSTLLSVDVRSATYIVLYYDQLRDLFKIFGKEKFLCIIADEAHNINNRNALRTKQLKQFKAYRRIAMSATPIQATVADMWSVLNWLEPDQFRSFWQYANAYCVVENDGYGAKIKYTKKSTIDILAKLIKPIVIRKLKRDDDVAPFLPEMTHVHVPIILGTKQRKIYDKIAKADDFIVDLSDVLAPEDYAEFGFESGDIKSFSRVVDGSGTIMVSNILAQMIRLQQLSAMPESIGVRNVENPKLDWLLGFLENNPTEQIVIFSRFRSVAQQLYKILHKQYGGCGLIVGGAEPISVDGFRRGNVKYLVGTIGAMGTALDLPMATAAIFFDSEWSSIKMYQATNRIDRFVEEPLHKMCYYLEGADTVDIDVRKGLTQKLSTIAIVTKYMQGRANQ